MISDRIDLCGTTLFSLTLSLKGIEDYEKSLILIELLSYKTF